MFCHSFPSYVIYIRWHDPVTPRHTGSAALVISSWEGPPLCHYVCLRVRLAALYMLCGHGRWFVTVTLRLSCTVIHRRRSDWVAFAARRLSLVQNFRCTVIIYSGLETTQSFHCSVKICTLVIALRSQFNTSFAIAQLSCLSYPISYFPFLSLFHSLHFSTLVYFSLAPCHGPCARLNWQFSVSFQAHVKSSLSYRISFLFRFFCFTLGPSSPFTDYRTVYCAHAHLFSFFGSF